MKTDVCCRNMHGWLLSMSATSCMQGRELSGPQASRSLTSADTDSGHKGLDAAHRVCCYHAEWLATPAQWDGVKLLWSGQAASDTQRVLGVPAMLLAPWPMIHCLRRLQGIPLAAYPMRVMWAKDMPSPCCCCAACASASKPSSCPESRNPEPFNEGMACTQQYWAAEWGG